VTQQLAEKYSMDQWKTDLTPWSEMVESGRHEMGDCWLFYVFAFLASSTKSPRKTSSEVKDLLNHDADLCVRARYARRNAGNAGWWVRHLEAEVAYDLKTFVLLMFFA